MKDKSNNTQPPQSQMVGSEQRHIGIGMAMEVRADD